MTVFRLFRLRFGIALLHSPSLLFVELWAKTAVSFMPPLILQPGFLRHKLRREKFRRFPPVRLAEDRLAHHPTCDGSPGVRAGSSGEYLLYRLHGIFGSPHFQWLGYQCATTDRTTPARESVDERCGQGWWKRGSSHLL